MVHNHLICPSWVLRVTRFPNTQDGRVAGDRHLSESDGLTRCLLHQVTGFLTPIVYHISTDTSRAPTEEITGGYVPGARGREYIQFQDGTVGMDEPLPSPVKSLSTRRSRSLPSSIPGWRSCSLASRAPRGILCRLRLASALLADKRWRRHITPPFHDLTTVVTKTPRTLLHSTPLVTSHFA